MADSKPGSPGWTRPVPERGEGLFQKIFEEGPLGMALVDLDFRFIRVSSRLCDMVGYSEQELLNLTFPEITHPDDVEKDVHLANQVFRGEIPHYRIEKRYFRKDQSSIWVALTASVIRDERGAPLYGLAMVEDITDHRNEGQEQVRLERLRALGEMAQGVAHNFNNMLVSVLGYAQLIQLRATDPVLTQYADQIVDGALRAKAMVERINQSVREEEKDTLYPVPVHEVVQDVVETVRPRWKDEPEARGVSIEMKTELEPVPAVRGTHAGLRDVLRNLLFNAVDALRDGGAIVIGARNRGDIVELTVRDTGVGMDEETRRRIFEPFFTTKADVGTGLGLSTVYGTVSRWGGRIEVQSARGKGTTVTLRLLAWTGPVQVEEKPEPVAAPHSKILIVDDDRSVCQFFAGLLSSDHSVETAYSGEAALDRFSSGMYEIAFVDLGMPGMPGNELAQKMKELDSEIVVVLITGWDLVEGDPRMAPFDFRLKKPLSTVRDLAGTVAQAATLHGQRKGDSSA